MENNQPKWTCNIKGEMMHCEKCKHLLTIEQICAEVECAECGHKNLILCHMLGVQRYDGDKFGTLPEVEKMIL